MTIVQKQVYESNFNMIGYFLKEAYEKSTGAKKKQIANLIGNINQMYLYTNMLETENHILQSREDEVNNVVEQKYKLEAVLAVGYPEKEDVNSTKKPISEIVELGMSETSKTRIPAV